MPYSFTQIEKDRSRIIVWVFGFLVLFYFVVFLSIATILRNYFYFDEIDRRLSLLSVKECFIVFLIAAILGVGHWWFSISDLLRKLIRVLGAERPNSGDPYHRTFQNIINEVSVATGGEKMEGIIVPTSALNAFAVTDFSGRKIIGITEGALARLTRSQLEAVVGHEAAHLVSGDCLATTGHPDLFFIVNHQRY